MPNGTGGLMGEVQQHCQELGQTGFPKAIRADKIPRYVATSVGQFQSVIDIGDLSGANEPPPVPK